MADDKEEKEDKKVKKSKKGEVDKKDKKKDEGDDEEDKKHKKKDEEEDKKRKKKDEEEVDKKHNKEDKKGKKTTKKRDTKQLYIKPPRLREMDERTWKRVVFILRTLILLLIVVQIFLGITGVLTGIFIRQTHHERAFMKMRVTFAMIVLITALYSSLHFCIHAFGFYGIYVRGRSMIIVYAWGIMVLLVILSTFLIFLIMYVHRNEEFGEYYLFQMVEYYSANIIYTELIDALQTHLKCCGVYSRGDWHRIYHQRTVLYQRYPPSCCDTPNIMCSYFYKEALYKNSCLHHFELFTLNYGILGIIILIVLISSLLLLLMMVLMYRIVMDEAEDDFFYFVFEEDIIKHLWYRDDPQGVGEEMQWYRRLKQLFGDDSLETGDTQHKADLGGAPMRKEKAQFRAWIKADATDKKKARVKAVKQAKTAVAYINPDTNQRARYMDIFKGKPPPKKHKKKSKRKKKR